MQVTGSVALHSACSCSPRPPASTELCYQPRLFVSLSLLVYAPLRATWLSSWLLSAVIKRQCVLIVQKRCQGHSPHTFSRPWPTRPQHGEVLPLKIVTYAAVSLSLAALLVAFALLALVRTLRSNLNGIHRNLIAALFSSQLVFVVGIAQTENPVRTLPLPGRARADLPPGLEQEGSSHPFLGLGGVCGRVRGWVRLGGLVGSWGPRPSTWACGFALSRNLPARSPWEPRALCASVLTFLIQMLVFTSESTLVRPQSPASRHLSLKSSLWGHVSQPCTFWGVTASLRESTGV